MQRCGCGDRGNMPPIVHVWFSILSPGPPVSLSARSTHPPRVHLSGSGQTGVAADAVDLVVLRLACGAV